MSSRNTVQKDAIYAALCSLANHPTADMIYETVHEKYPSISKTTVYRVLNQMTDTGKVMKVRISDGADHFDHQSHEHLHIRCKCCGKVADVQAPELGLLTDRVTDAKGFKVEDFYIQFNGICPECALKGGERDGG